MDARDVPGSLVDKCVGTMLGVAVGDILGAPVEGWRASRIAREFPNGVTEYVPCRHMGVENLGERCGMYTDDTNATLALAESIVKMGGIVPEHIAFSCVKYWLSVPKRGMPPTIQALFKSYLDPKNDRPGYYRTTGRLHFPDGSWANGGAMKISPVALVCRGAASEDQRYHAVTEALVNTHVHPESVDAAYVLAAAIQRLLPLQPGFTLDPVAFLTEMQALSRNPTMKENVGKLVEAMRAGRTDDDAILADFCESFQIKAVEAVPASLLAFARHWNNPRQSLIHAIGWGGDTDTIASMAGALAGAAHGASWIPREWLDNMENGPAGRDFLISLAKQIAVLEPNLDTLGAARGVDEAAAIRALRDECHAAFDERQRERRAAAMAHADTPIGGPAIAQW